MNIDVEFSIWFAQFQYLDSFFSFISTRWVFCYSCSISRSLFLPYKATQDLCIYMYRNFTWRFNWKHLKELLSDTVLAMDIVKYLLKKVLFKGWDHNRQDAVQSCYKFLSFSTLLHLTSETNI
ncbi:MAG: hypothetical protein Ct9H90mP19_3170 [Gammaproteobacteria bacterium]|nr:MAG: hypothetical protein Ct9H90mP19_3170 [Gammaproteobacteria bacterium]